MNASDHPFVRLRGVLGRIDPRMEWPHGAVRLGVMLCALVSAALGLVYYGRAVERLGDDASRNAGLSYDDREFGPGNGLGVDKNALYEARASIPRGASYRIVVGPRVPGTEFARRSIEPFARYFLMPRRPDPDARWVLCYGCDLSRFGAAFRTVWDNGSGIAIGRLRE